MLYAYLFAVLAGGGLLGFTLVAGDHHGGGEGADAGGGDHGEAGPGETVLGLLLSLRTLTYFLTFGGLTGVLLTLLAHAGAPLTALLSAAVGLGTGVGARLAFSRATALGPSGVVQAGQLAGRTGQLLLPCAPDSAGRVRVTVGGSTVDLIARTDDVGGIPARDEVLIIEVRDGEALVVRSPARDGRGEGPAR